jgi:flagellar biosynthetic protein FliO
MGGSGSDLAGLGGSLALSFVSLAVVCVVAYGVLRWLARKPGGGGSCISVLGRCHLEPRRSVYLLCVGGRCFLVGVGDGTMSLLAEIEPASLPVAPAAGELGAASLAGWLSAMLGKGRR